jgi:hypothetical protein
VQNSKIYGCLSRSPMTESVFAGVLENSQNGLAENPPEPMVSRSWRRGFCSLVVRKNSISTQFSLVPCNIVTSRWHGQRVRLLLILKRFKRHKILARDRCSNAQLTLEDNNLASAILAA